MSRFTPYLGSYNVIPWLSKFNFSNVILCYLYQEETTGTRQCLYQDNRILIEDSVICLVSDVYNKL